MLGAAITGLPIFQRMFPLFTWVAANVVVLGLFIQFDDASELVRIILLRQLYESEAFSAGTGQRGSSRIDGLWRRFLSVFMVVLLRFNFGGVFK